MAETWITVQTRVRGETHEYLKETAAQAGISITQVVGALLDDACKKGLVIGPLTVMRPVMDPEGK